MSLQNGLRLFNSIRTKLRFRAQVAGRLLSQSLGVGEVLTPAPGSNTRSHLHSQRLTCLLLVFSNSSQHCQDTMPLCYGLPLSSLSRACYCLVLLRIDCPYGLVLMIVWD
jgi:hypothetical protein